MRKVEDKIDIAALFPPGEHGIYAYYGRIGSGKTYAMTADVLQALSRGRVVYTNYPITYDGYNQTLSLFWLFIGLFGFKKRYYEFPKENLRHIDIDEDFHDNFGKLTDCIVALDEGYVVFDSYQLAKMSMTKRKNVLHTRHFDRSIWYTTQRPSAIHVTMRAQTNVFYKITRLIKLGSFLLFRRQEFDLSSDEAVDESHSYGTKLYIGSKDVFRAYDTKYLREGANASQQVSVIVHTLKYGRKISRFLSVIKTFFALKGKKRSDTLSVSSVGGNDYAPTLKSPEGLNTVGTGRKLKVKELQEVEYLPF